MPTVTIPLAGVLTDIECPFCAWRTGRRVRGEAIPMVAHHVRGCHPERLAAQDAFRAARERGLSEADAQVEANRVLDGLVRGPGRYDRSHA